jgi:hypothetical protein
VKFTLGCDPEIFLMDAAGALKSAVGLIGGSKEHPLPLPLGDGYAVQEDNVAIEFNIPPADHREQFVASIGNTVAFLADQVFEMYGLRLSGLSASSFDAKELDSPAAKMFGCDPDFNVWTNKPNPRPNAKDKSLRSCGGHVHIGYPIKDVDQANRLGKLLDLFLGAPSTLMDDGDLRKQLYGKMGAVRYKPYGLEYRVLSNFWVFNEQRRSWVWDNTTLALQMLDTDFDIDKLREPLFNAINKNNKDVAYMLVNTYNVPILE